RSARLWAWTRRVRLWIRRLWRQLRTGLSRAGKSKLLRTKLLRAKLFRAACLWPSLWPHLSAVGLRLVLLQPAAATTAAGLWPAAFALLFDLLRLQLPALGPV